MARLTPARSGRVPPEDKPSNRLWRKNLSQPAGDIPAPDVTPSAPDCHPSAVVALHAQPDDGLTHPLVFLIR